MPQSASYLEECSLLMSGARDEPARRPDLTRSGVRIVDSILNEEGRIRSRLNYLLATKQSEYATVE